MRLHRKAPSRVELSWEQEDELTYGPVVASAFESPFTRLAAWKLYRAKFMDKYEVVGVDDARDAGSRPWAWWQYDAPEKPRKIGSAPPLPDFPPDARVKCSCGQWHVGVACVFEDETECLRRLGLLTAQEEALLAAEKG